MKGGKGAGGRRLFNLNRPTLIFYPAETGWPNVFSLVFEKNPLKTPTDFSLSISMLPLHICYHEPTASDLLDFLFLPQTDFLEVTWGLVHQSYQYLGQFTK